MFKLGRKKVSRQVDNHIKVLNDPSNISCNWFVLLLNYFLLFYFHDLQYRVLEILLSVFHRNVMNFLSNMIEML